MREAEMTAVLKLGTGLRYLIDVREGMKLGDKHVLANMAAILTLIPELGFSDTAGHACYRQFESLYEELRRASAERLTISSEEAERLEKVARRVRDVLYGEAEGRKIIFGGRPTRYQIALTVVTVVLLAVCAMVSPQLFDSIDAIKPWLIGAAVGVMAMTGIWSSKGLRAPGLWLGFLGLIGSLIYAASGS